jgi:hypothetical protein
MKEMIDEGLRRALEQSEAGEFESVRCIVEYLQETDLPTFIESARNSADRKRAAVVSGLLSAVVLTLPFQQRKETSEKVREAIAQWQNAPEGPLIPYSRPLQPRKTY